MFTVAVLVRDGLSLFEFGVTAEVFGIDRTEVGAPPIDFRVCSEHGPRWLETKHVSAVRIESTHGLDGLIGADVVIVSASLPHTGTEAERAALRRAHTEGAVIVSLCSGAFLLAGAGLLDGRQASTHWLFADQLTREFPHIDVIEANLFTDAGQIVTAAGTAAAIDTCLHIVRREIGATTARMISRRMVAAPTRHGNQLQFVDRPLPEAGATGLSATLEWAASRLGENIDAPALARHANVSVRQLGRRFRQELGTTPLQWITQERIRAAQELLEVSDLSIETIGRKVGYSSATQLREHFHRSVGTSPSQYRESFTAVTSSSGGRPSRRRQGRRSRG